MEWKKRLFSNIFWRNALASFGERYKIGCRNIDSNMAMWNITHRFFRQVKMTSHKKIDIARPITC